MKRYLGILGAIYPLLSGPALGGAIALLGGLTSYRELAKQGLSIGLIIAAILGTVIVYLGGDIIARASNTTEQGPRVLYGIGGGITVVAEVFVLAYGLSTFFQQRTATMVEVGFSPTAAPPFSLFLMIGVLFAVPYFFLKLHSSEE